LFASSSRSIALVKEIRLAPSRAIAFPQNSEILFDKINIAKDTSSIFMKSSDIQYVSDEKGDAYG